MEVIQQYIACFRTYALLVFAVFLFANMECSAQNLPEFNMSDTAITICTGILYDSGGEFGLYDNNQNITTVINPGGVITLTFFGTFSIENGLDQLAIYDGPNTGSPLLGIFTGTTLPPILTATSGTVTLVFTSDNSAIYAGFSMQWETDNPPPVPPDISVPVMPTCNQSALNISFSYPIECTWLDDAEWAVMKDNVDLAIVSVSQNCSGGVTNGVTLTMAQPFVANCDYMIELVIGIPDDCGLIYVFTVNTTFNYDGCGVSGNIVAGDDVLCPGSCTTLTANVNGCFSYTYTWSNGLPATAGPHSVCPTTNTTYTVLVTETETGSSATFSYTLNVLSSSIAAAGDTLCQSVDGFFIQSAVNGIWSGPGIMDEETGFFEPDSANVGDNIIYFDALGCIDSVDFFILPIQTDDISAACPGSSPFQLSAVPAGGSWSGLYTSATGIFDPSTEGTYIIEYTLGTCTDLLTINVDSISGVFQLDSICQSILVDTLIFSPLGGYWSGPGIADSLLGIFIPEDAPPGDLILTYTINGCSQVATVFIKQIDIGDSFHTTCPTEDPLVWYDGSPQPPGGYWEGAGLLSTVTGLFDPSLIPNDSYTSIIYYAPNGCSDTTYIYNRQTEIALDSAWFCLADDAYELIESNVGHAPPYGGNWTGIALSNPSYDYWLFSPQQSGVGTFELTYEKNNCSDSIIMIVFPDGLPNTSNSFCTNEPGIVFGQNVQTGGIWSGNGIVNAFNGSFNPSFAAPGDFYIYWITPAGCSDSISVTVEEYFQASITGIGDVYCFEDTLIEFTVVPENGIFIGANPDATFNPSELDEGSNEIIYTYTGALCSSSDTVSLNVLPEILVDLTASDVLVCEGQGLVLTATAAGGNPDILLTYTWSTGAFPVSTSTIQPTQNMVVSVVVNDGCSDSAVDSVSIIVLPPILVDVVTSDTLCFGEDGFAQASAISVGNFSYAWDGSSGASLDAPAGSQHSLLVTDLINGCEFDSLIVIPNYSPLSANFSINPNVSCIPFADASSVNIIDFSQNAVSGTWDLGNAGTEPYVQGETPNLSFSDAGSFSIVLYVMNEGGCVDTAFADICILPSVPVFIPDIFSPNGDGSNDILFVRSQGIVKMNFEVYNRWGEKVFTSDDPKFGWDGQWRGQPALSGSYLYYMKSTMNDGSEIEMKGEIALIR